MQQIKFWQLQNAKAKLSELVRNAINKGPQGISIRGREEIIVISKSDYDNLTHTTENFWSFMRKSPLKGIDINISRDKSTDRDVIL